MKFNAILFTFMSLGLLIGCSSSETYDVLIKNGQIVDGSGNASFIGDIAIFDPDKIQDIATFEEPHQYVIGMKHVFVNGTQVLKDGEHSGAFPGKVVRDPGWNGK